MYPESKGNKRGVVLHIYDKRCASSGASWRIISTNAGCASFAVLVFIALASKFAYNSRREGSSAAKRNCSTTGPAIVNFGGTNCSGGRFLSFLVSVSCK